MCRYSVPTEYSVDKCTCEVCTYFKYSVLRTYMHVDTGCRARSRYVHYIHVGLSESKKRGTGGAGRLSERAAGHSARSGAAAQSENTAWTWKGEKKKGDKCAKESDLLVRSAAMPRLDPQSLRSEGSVWSLDAKCAP